MYPGDLCGIKSMIICKSLNRSLQKHFSPGHGGKPVQTGLLLALSLRKGPWHCHTWGFCLRTPLLQGQGWTPCFLCISISDSRDLPCRTLMLGLFQGALVVRQCITHHPKPGGAEQLLSPLILGWAPSEVLLISTGPHVFLCRCPSAGWLCSRGGPAAC